MKYFPVFQNTSFIIQCFLGAFKSQKSDKLKSINFIDSQKINEFKTMQKKAGRETKRLSFKLILTMRPANISSASPREEIKRIKGNLSPINKPKAPVISNKTIYIVNKNMFQC